MAQQMSDVGVLLITTHEGLSFHPFLDSDGYVRVGYGHTLFVNREPLIGEAGLLKANALPCMEMDEHRAMGLLRSDLMGVRIALEHLLTRRLTQRRFDALATLAYCLYQEHGRPMHEVAEVLGTYAPELVRHINSGNYEAAADHFLVPSLNFLRTARRQSARHHFLQTDWNEPCAENYLPSTLFAMCPGCSLGSSCRSCVTCSR